MKRYPFILRMFDDHLTKPVPGYVLGKKNESRAENVMARPARWWKRLLAMIVDIVVFNIIVAQPFRGLVPTEISLSMSFSAQDYYVAFAAVMLFYLYVMASQYVTGQTVGMMLMRIRTEPEGRMWRFFVRNLYMLPVFPFVLLWIFDPLHMFMTGDRLTERWSGTRTIEVENG